LKENQKYTIIDTMPLYPFFDFLLSSKNKTYINQKLNARMIAPIKIVIFPSQ